MPRHSNIRKDKRRPSKIVILSRSEESVGVHNEGFLGYDTLITQRVESKGLSRVQIQILRCAQNDNL